MIENEIVVDVVAEDYRAKGIETYPFAIASPGVFRLVVGPDRITIKREAE